MHAPPTAGRRALLVARRCRPCRQLRRGGACVGPRPARPLRLIVPFTPGGSTDILARALAPQAWQAALGLNVIVDNRPGAGGSLGAAEAAQAPSPTATRC